MSDGGVELSAQELETVPVTVSARLLWNTLQIVSQAKNLDVPAEMVALTFVGLQQALSSSLRLYQASKANDGTAVDMEIADA